MLLRKYPLAALGLLLILSGLVHVSAQTQQTQQKKRKDREILKTDPKPFVQFSEHPELVSYCAGSDGQAQMVLTATVDNYQNPDLLEYVWKTDGGTITGTKATVNGNQAIVTATWDLSTAEPEKIYTARVEVDNKREDGCYAYASTKVRLYCHKVELCPNISITGPPEPLAEGTRQITFTATVNGGTAGVSPIYNWTITGGTFIGGQGTPSITIDTTGLEGQSITATLSVEGFNLSCASDYKVFVPRKKIKSYPCDEYARLKRDDEKARLDNCMISVQNDPSAKLYIIVYTAPGAKPGEYQRRKKFMTDYLTARGFDPARIDFIDGGTRDELRTQIWIVPLGAELPPIR